MPVIGSRTNRLQVGRGGEANIATVLYCHYSCVWWCYSKPKLFITFCWMQTYAYIYDHLWTPSTRFPAPHWRATPSGCKSCGAFPPCPVPQTPPVEHCPRHFSVPSVKQDLTRLKQDLARLPLFEKRVSAVLAHVFRLCVPFRRHKIRNPHAPDTPLCQVKKNKT